MNRIPKVLSQFICVIPLVLLIGCQPEGEPAQSAATPEGIDQVLVEQLEQAAASAIAAETRAPTGARTATAEPELPVPPEQIEGETPMPDPTTLADLLPDLGDAPEINNEVWINSEPLTMAALRGKVVLIEFWTFG